MPLTPRPVQRPRLSSMRATCLVPETRPLTPRQLALLRQSYSTYLVETTSPPLKSSSQSTFLLLAGVFCFFESLFANVEFALFSLWAFNSSSRLWANYSRAPMPELGSTGTVGTFGPSNSPMARTSGNMWIDSKGYVWLFGGQTSAGVINGTPYSLEFFC